MNKIAKDTFGGLFVSDCLQTNSIQFMISIHQNKIPAFIPNINYKSILVCPFPIASKLPFNYFCLRKK